METSKLSGRPVGPGQTLNDILLRADQNLYVAKNRGRDCIVATTGFGPVFA